MQTIVSNIAPDIRFIKKGGIMRLTKKVVNLLSIKDGDAINILSDSENGEYYLYVSEQNALEKDPNTRGIVRMDGKKSIRITWKDLVEYMIGVIDTENEGFANVKVGKVEMIDGRPMLPIITRRNIKCKPKSDIRD